VRSLARGGLFSRAGATLTAIERTHAASSFGATGWQLIRKVILPSSIPETIVAMRIGFGWSPPMQTTPVIRGIVLIAAIAYGFDRLMRFVERRLVPGKGRG
jgi:taurine transport system permease protein